MSASDDILMLADFGGRLDAVHSQPELRLALQIEMVDQADRGARGLLDGMEARYFAGDAGTEQADQALVSGPIALYCAQREAAYIHLVRQFQTFSQGWAEAADTVPMIVARALRATSMRLKWQLMRYLPVEKDIWQTLSQLWAFVEDKGMERARVVVYDDRSTLPREFVKPLILSVSAADSLPALEVEIAFRVIEYLADRFEFQRHPGKSSNFFIDIDRWTAPERFTPVSVVRPGARFFGAGRIMDQIDELVAQVAVGEILPSEMNLEGLGDMGAVIHALEHLGRHWWARRPERRTERRRSLTQIGVVHGFDAILQQFSTDDISGQKLPVAENWNVDNESEDGYGAMLPAGRGDWLHVGKIIALKPADSRIWAVGIVRRLAAQQDGQRNIGIELLARGARPVTLRRRSDAGQTWKALLLPAHSGGDASLGEVSLLLPVGCFLPDSSLEMEVYSTGYILEPRLLLEHGTEFEMARYRILQRADT
ncbi:MAG: hypothetical protein ABI648_04410 [Betaproteobacteria bacterium]